MLFLECATALVATTPTTDCEQVVTQRLMRLNQQGQPSHEGAKVVIKRRKASPSGMLWEVVTARGHIDEVLALSQGVTDLTRLGCGACVHPL